MTHKLKIIEPDALLCQIEDSLDRLSYYIKTMDSRKRPPTGFFREILVRRIHLTQLSKQIRGNKKIKLN